ncbi:hypothetical protein [Nonomuraea typhae]|uniref:hypothetical protein n=1 Tax=Nonomuraea typhae TaxID=2603600 RepID=UPI001CA599A5
MLPPFGPVRLEATFTLYGLGLMHGRLCAPRAGLQLDVVASARPVEPWEVHFTVGVAVTPAPANGTVSSLPRPLAKALCRAMVPLNLRLLLALEVGQDVPVFARKRYTSPPRLARGDGPIRPYRKWAAQFYTSTPGLGR